MKWLKATMMPHHILSLSVWRVWIEIAIRRLNWLTSASLSVWRVWIEIEERLYIERYLLSLSVWRVWIEILLWNGLNKQIHVTLCMESVD